jgi:glutamate dehydrogenase (NAD(P)+)
MRTHTSERSTFLVRLSSWKTTHDHRLTRQSVTDRPAPKNSKPATQDRDPVFDELGFPKDPDNLYLPTVEVLLKAADLIGMEHGVKCIMAQPQSEIMVHFPERMDNGEFKLFKGYRVQHNKRARPYKGGLRFHPDVHLDDCEEPGAPDDHEVLAGPRPPFGGGKGGVQVRPAQAQQG